MTQEEEWKLGLYDRLVELGNDYMHFVTSVFERDCPAYNAYLQRLIRRGEVDLAVRVYDLARRV